MLPPIYVASSPFTTQRSVPLQMDVECSLSLTGLPDDPDCDRIIAEARFDRLDLQDPYAELSIMVDEAYQNIGVGTYLCKILAHLAKERQLKGFTVEVLSENIIMHHVLKKMGWKMSVKRLGGVNRLTMVF